MAETKHKTTLEIGVDDRALKELADSMDRALSTRTADAFEKSLERTSKALGKLVEQQAKMLKLQTDQAKLNRSERGQKDRAREDAQKTRDADRGMMERFRQTDTYKVGHAALSGASRAGTTLVGGEGAFAGALSAIPFIGPMIGAAVGAASGFYGSHVAHQTAEAAAYGQTGIGGREDSYGPFSGVRYGVMPSELPGLVAEYMQGAQVRGPGAAGMFSSALDMNKLLGIGLGTTGGFQQAGTLLGNKQGFSPEAAQASVEEALSTGMEMGIRGARLDQYLAQMTGALDDMQNRGILIDPSSVTGMVRGLGSLGGAFRGQAGVNAALGMTTGMQNVANRGNLFGMLALQEAGYGRGRSYMQARQELELNPHQYAGALIGRVNRMGGDEEARAYMMQQQFREIGTTLSTQQAMQLAGMTEEQIAEFTTPGGGDRFREYLGRQDRSAFGTASAAAGLEYQRSTAGANVADEMVSLTRAEISISNRFLEDIVGFVDKTANYTEELLHIFDSEGMGGVFAHVFADLGNVISNAITSAVRATPEIASTAVTGALATGLDTAAWLRDQLPDGFLRDLADGFVTRLFNALDQRLTGGMLRIGSGP